MKPGGLFRLHAGPFWIIPRFGIRSIGLDSNVFYTAEDRQTDISILGGPSLDVVLPIKKVSYFYMQGALNYLFFVRTVSERRLNWSASTGLALNGQRTQLTLDESYQTTYERPSYEVDTRVDESLEQTTIALNRRLFWRLNLMLNGNRAHYDVQESEDYLGTDLSATLTRDEYRVGAGIGYAITVKTSFVIVAEQTWSHFPLDSLRDATWKRVAAGFRTDPTALIAGEALVGLQQFQPDSFPDRDQQTPWVSVAATWSISPKTQFTLNYRRGLNYSAFTPADAPLLQTEEAGVGLNKLLMPRVNLLLSARRTHLLSDGEVTIDIPDEGPITAVRDDTAWEYQADLGYFFRPNLRIGVGATYVDRNSTISYFGIEGLIFGVTVRYNP